MSNRTLYRIGCVGLSLLLLLLALTIYNTIQLRAYRHRLENTYLRSLQEISTHMNAVSVDLQKCAYAGSPAQVSAISAQVWKSAGAAKAALGSLPTGGLDLEDTYRFLSQVGDYAMYLSRKSVRGEEITPEERESFEQLRQYSLSLNDQIADMVYLISTGQAGLEQLMDGNEKISLGTAVPVNADPMGLDQHLQGYPTLIYDGPFSDHLIQKSPEMLKGQTVIQPQTARKAAADFADCPVDSLVQGSDEDSHMPSYSFHSEEIDLGVTKQGGHVAYLVNGRTVGNPSLTLEEGLKIAREYLELRHIGSMGETYYELYGGVLTVNYAYTQEDTICYTDLIKVGIAMDDGQVVFYDARGFLNNHKERDFSPPLLSIEEAQSVLSTALSPRQVQLALVPTTGQNEALTYEFLCRANDGSDVLVYINVETGAEEQILILLKNENGTLTV